MRAMRMEDLSGFNAQKGYTRVGGGGDAEGFEVSLPRLVHHGKKVRVHLPPVKDAEGHICGYGGSVSVGDGDILFKTNGEWSAMYKESFLRLYAVKV